MARKRTAAVKGSQLIQFSPNSVKGLKVQARRIDGTLTSFARMIRETNQEGLTWVQKRAAKNLQTRIDEHGKPQKYNSRRLKKAIVNPKYSSYSYDGFRLMIHSLIAEDVPYYRAIERGDPSQLRQRRMVFSFLDGNNRRIMYRDGSRNDVIIGPRQRKALGFRVEDTPEDRFGVGVYVNKAVPAYRYAQDAFDTYLSQGMFKRALKRRAKAKGLTVV